MRFLLIHQNFPGQFRQLVPYLSQRGHELIGICSHQRPLPALPNTRVLRYAEPPSAPASLTGRSRLWHEALARAEAVARLCADLNRQGWQPDCIAVHCGWGESLGLQDIWPEIPQIVWPELWMREEHLGEPTCDPLSHFERNLLTRTALSMARAWVLPTQHQARSLPPSFQDQRLHVIHEGIDAKKTAVPNREMAFAIRGIPIDRTVPVLTLVNRQLEQLRGFDVFMRALPRLQQRHPRLRVLIVGDNEPGYGPGHPSGRPLKEVMLEELSSQLDLERLHFLGRIPHPHLISVLQASSVHVYLSSPFILGWSLLEAMACGCCIVGSEGPPVSEVLEHGVEGLLIPGRDADALAEAVDQLLHSEETRQRLGKAARQRALLYDQRLTLPALADLLEQTGSGDQAT